MIFIGTIGWLFLSIVAGVVASTKGRSGIGYTIFALICSPLIVLLVLAAIPNLVYIDQQGVQHRVTLPDPNSPQQLRYDRKVGMIILGIVLLVAAGWMGPHIMH